MAKKALILVGGGTRGTRFRPLSLESPKVLFPVAGKPIVSHAIDAAATLPSVQEIVLVGFHPASTFNELIAQTKRQYPNIVIKYLQEYKPLGTAGGLYHFRDEILSGDPEAFFVIHADVCSSFPLEEIETFYKNVEADAVILATNVPKQTVVGNFGSIVVADDGSGKVVHYVEKPESALSTLVNAGVYLFNKSIFDTIAEAKKERSDQVSSGVSFDTDPDFLSLERDILSKLPHLSNTKFYAYVSKDFWRQIKTAGSALPANSLYLQKLDQSDSKSPGLLPRSSNIIPPVYADETAIIDPTAKLGPNVSIGKHVTIGKGARVRDSVILNGTEIKHDAVILNTIISDDCKIGSWARIEGSSDSTAASTSAASTGYMVGITDGVSVGSSSTGVSILASNVLVGDEVHIKNSVILNWKEIKSDVCNEVIM
ncbi:nucleotide-diphospho-sugar transferase [Nadsonia fulvescens var. elongata DSM 6958]|uniref:mannose-1-phosphate guanylyltransferase n=1 Tax=Nadsonia fulvescens var. elongata DSM 6958 TaxID=857566 RepID=A0A1E3PLB1_9ASCO|nr:nucleotide-diphospho-sugar transferase [Nadsonia fulvescens var. elongata DSM 6958]